MANNSIKYSSKEIRDVISWIKKLNLETEVKITKKGLSDDKFWFLDCETGFIKNKKNAFFSVVGIEGCINGNKVEQPIIVQDEIGYLGLLCKDFDGITKFLMQAKIEPGNINCVQLSPTIQATMSNFTQKHGGKRPLYLEYFSNAQDEEIIFDQIQSEQSSRFLGKRNRNIIVKTKKDVVIYNKYYRWMTLDEIKQLMCYDNIVNMDTRTVLSSLPLIDPNFCFNAYGIRLGRHTMESLNSNDFYNEIKAVYYYINNYKMFVSDDKKKKSLLKLNNWIVGDETIEHRNGYYFKVIYCDILIEGREVTKWSQPLFMSNGKATFGLIRTVIDNKYKFIVRAKPEIGCFDKIEIGPTIQREFGDSSFTVIDAIFNKYYSNNKNIVFNSVLSEEGGRFYHEENNNIIIDIPYEELPKLPEDYFYLSYKSLFYLLTINNCVNIQLRNLLSVMNFDS